MTIGIGAIMVAMTLIVMPLMDRMGRRTLHLYGLGGMFIFSIFITISFLIKVSTVVLFFGIILFLVYLNLYLVLMEGLQWLVYSQSLYQCPFINKENWNKYEFPFEKLAPFFWLLTALKLLPARSFRV